MGSSIISINGEDIAEDSEKVTTRIQTVQLPVVIGFSPPKNYYPVGTKVQVYVMSTSKWVCGLVETLKAKHLTVVLTPEGSPRKLLKDPMSIALDLSTDPDLIRRPLKEKVVNKGDRIVVTGLPPPYDNLNNQMGVAWVKER